MAYAPSILIVGVNKTGKTNRAIQLMLEYSNLHSSNPIYFCHPYGYSILTHPNKDVLNIKNLIEIHARDGEKVLKPLLGVKNCMIVLDEAKVYTSYRKEAKLLRDLLTQRANYNVTVVIVHHTLREIQGFEYAMSNILYLFRSPEPYNRLRDRIPTNLTRDIIEKAASLERNVYMRLAYNPQ